MSHAVGIELRTASPASDAGLIKTRSALIFIGSPRLFHSAFTPSPSDSLNPGGNMKRQLTGALGHSILLVAAVLAASLVAAGPAQAITNGQPDGTRHPNVGLMVVNFGSGPEPFCTGTLIAPTRFLTAAHCIAFLHQFGGEMIGVTFDPRTFDPSRPVIAAVDTEVDPAFGHDQGDFHELAVITLQRPAPSVPAVLPAAGLLDQLAAHAGLRD